MIDGISKAELERVYNAIKDAKESVLIVSEDKKKAENKLKEEFASAKGFYKKDGTTLDLAKVKMKLVKSGIEVKETGVNKLEEELALQEEYIADLTNGNITKGFVDSYISKLRLEKETKETEKDVKENLKTTVDSDIVEAISMIVKGDLDKEKENMDAEDGKKTKSKKDDSELMEMIREIKKTLGLK